MNEMPELNIILIISIGNSMGWPYDHYIDYDIANLNMFESINDFLHVTAHEINHIIVGPLLGKKVLNQRIFSFKTLHMKELQFIIIIIYKHYLKKRNIMIKLMECANLIWIFMRKTLMKYSK